MAEKDGGGPFFFVCVWEAWSTTKQHRSVMPTISLGGRLCEQMGVAHGKLFSLDAKVVEECGSEVT